MADTYEVRLKAMMDVSDVQSNVKAIQNALGKLKLPNNIDKGFKQNFDNVYKDIAKYQELLNKPVKTAADASQIEKLSSSISKQINNIRKDINSLNGEELHLKTDDANLKQYISSLAEVKKNINEIATKNVDVTTFDNFISKLKQADPASDKLKKTIDQLRASLSKGDTEGMASGVAKLAELLPKINGFKGDNFTQTFEKLGITLDKDQQNLQGLISKLMELSGKANGAFGELPKRAQDLQNNINGIHANAFENIAKILLSASSAAKGTSDAILAMGRSEASAAQETARLDKQFKDLQQSTQYFFSLRNMFNLLKRGIKEAFDVVKDLDKAMTDTAVVTDMSVSDLWKQLPDYTDIANRLGATTQGAYETMTLYYQQGLNQQQAFALGEETIKMARIAGQDYAETTDMMTAALRGFNMELNQTSAARVNDVYSQLAAKTASSTSEIGSAMERTASIAHSANMDFETTAAFLAQMIETTREAPENLGTAMKTIVARFQELKKNPNEIVEVDGEEVDYNRVDTALKSIGVSLVDNQDKFRDLDDVFLDIASRWDSLSQMQQRYVATMAAGSRQQSRFIAMMNNYERTQELVAYATDSAGASNEQFNKTLDSLESKLNQLKNAWDQFLMGITNSDFIKGAVDILTGGLTKLNEIIDKLSGKRDFLQTLISVGTGFVGLRFAGKVVNSLTGQVGNLLDPQRNLVGRGGSDVQATGRSAQQAKQIYAPIVQAINQLKAVMQGQSEGGQFTGVLDKQAFKQVQSDFRKQLASSIGVQGGTSVESLKGTFNGMSGQQQARMLQGLPGFNTSLQKSFNAAVDTMNLDMASKIAAKRFGAGLIKQAKRGEMSMDKVLTIMSSKTELGQAIGGQVGQSILKGVQSSWTDEEKAKLYREIFPNKAVKSNGKAKTDKEIARILKQGGEQSKAVEEEIRKRTAPADQLLTGTTYTKTQKIADSFGKITGAATSAGMAIQNVGAALSMAGFTTAGSVLSTIGSGLTSIGMAASSAASMVSSLAGMVGGLGPAIGIVAGLGVVFGLLTKEYIDQKKAIEDTRKAAEDLITQYQNTTAELDNNIAKLKEYKDIYAQLAAGVDANGNNVSLGQGEYEDYIKYTNEIAEINKDVVKSYNEQGDAILVNNEALERTIAEQEKLRKEAEDKYFSTANLQLIIDSRDTEKAFTNAFSRVTSMTDFYGNNQKVISKEVEGLLDTPARNIRDILKKTDFKAFTDEFDISFDNITIETVKSLNEQSDKIQKWVSDNYTDLAEEDVEALKDYFESLTSGYSEYIAANQPVLDWLKDWAARQNYNIDDALFGSFYSSLENVTLDSNNKTAEDMQRVTNQIANSYVTMGGYVNDYTKQFESVEKAQEEFLNGTIKTKEEYQASIEDEISATYEMVSALEDMAAAGDPAAASIAEFLENNIYEWAHWATEGIISVEDALNSFSSQIEEAKTAYDKFEETTKERGNSSDGRESFKSIIDAIDVEKHASGKGDTTFWTGIESIFGSDYVTAKGTTTDKAYAALQAIKPLFEEGVEGADAFDAKVKELWESNNKLFDGLIDIDDGDIKSFTLDGEEDLKRLADAFGITTEAMTALLDNYRQFGNLSFTNIDELATSLRNDSTTIEGTTTKGRDVGYFNLDSLRNYAIQQGIYGDEFQQLLKDLNAQNLKGFSLQDSSYKQLKQFLINTGVSNDGKGDFDLYDTVKQLATFGASQEEITDKLLGFGEADLQKLFGIQNIDELKTGISDAYASAMTEISEAEISEAEKTNNWLESIKGAVDVIAHESNPDYNGGYDRTTEQGQVYKAAQTGSVDDVYDYVNRTLSSNTDPQKFIQAADDLSQAVADGLLTEEDKNFLSGKYIPEEFQGGSKKIQATTDSYTKALTKAVEEGNKLNTDWSKTKYGNIDLQNRAKITNEEGFTETVLGGTMDFTRGATTIPIAFSPLLQTPDGGAVELSDAQIGAYFNEMLDRAFQQEGVIDPISGLINYQELDKALTTVDQIGTTLTTEEGTLIRVKGLYAGVGDEAENIAEKMHYIGQDQELGLNFQSMIDDLQAYGMSAQEIFSDLPLEVQQALAQTMSADFFSENGIDISQWVQTAATTTETAMKDAEFHAASDADVSPLGKKTEEATKPGAKKGVEEGAAEAQPTATVKYDSEGLPSLAPMSADVEIGTDGIPYFKKALVSAGEEGSDSLGSSVVSAASTAAPTITSTISSALATAGQAGKNSIQTALNGIKGPSVKIYPTLDKTTISAHSGGGTATIRLTMGSAANGVNMGSLAGGTGHGRLGPDGHGGLTLLGERGYEVVWLPSENRSMIVGTEGPQMMDLPGDAVVWDHKKSKQIVSTGGLSLGSLAEGIIPAGSHDLSASKGGKKYREKRGANVEESKSSKETAKSSKSSAKSNKETAKNSGNTAKNSSDTAKNTKKISQTEAQLYNRTKRIEALTEKISNLKDVFDKAIDTFGTTKSSLENNIKLQRSALRQSKKENSALEKYYNRQLKSLATGKKKVKVEPEGKGKAKKFTASKYINIDSATGALQIDQKAINKAPKKYRKALYDELTKQIDDLTSKRNSAAKAVQDAKDSLKELTQTINETFYDWENELKKFQVFASRVELDNSYQDMLQSQVDAITSMLDAGLTNVTASAEKYRTTMNRLVSSMGKEANDSFNKAIGSIQKFNEDYYGTGYSKDKRKQLKEARKYIGYSVNRTTGERNLTFDYAGLARDKAAGNITETTYNEIKDYFDTLESGIQDIYDSISEYHAILQDLADLRREQDDNAANMAHTLISGMEAEAQEEIDRLDAINSTISNAFSELIDKIRKELDRQRKLEQNAETEKDISNQMNRLAMLRADTSGGNQVEIAELERDIAKARGDYEDTLEDQMLDRLQEQADEASKQREKQIKLLSAQLDQSKKTGEYVKAAEDLVWKFINGTATAADRKRVEELYAASKGDEQTTVWDADTATNEANLAMTQVSAYKTNIENIDSQVAQISSRLALLDEFFRTGKFSDNTVAEALKNGLSIKELRDMDVTWEQIKKAGTDLVTMFKNGLSTKEAKGLGYTAQQMKKAGASNAAIKKAGWTKSKSDLTQLAGLKNKDGNYAFSGRQIQKMTGASAKEVKTALNSAKRDPKDMAGVKAPITVKGKKKTGTVNSVGNRVVKATGTGLAYQKLNDKGVPTGSTTVKKINELSLGRVNANKSEAAKALTKAITTKSVGKFLNKDWKDLVVAAGLVGKQFKLANGKTGSLNSNGKLYWDDGTTGVRIWDPSVENGLSLQKYDEKNKEKFTEKAKNKNVGREYAQVLIAVNKKNKKQGHSKSWLQKQGITQFATGGLASDTGLAWLDGTNSKPELILNAADTKNFIALKNVLTDLSHQGIFNDSGATGNATFDIDINVDKVSSDYDVDKIAARVKKVITNEAKHRNVTVMGRSR